MVKSSEELLRNFHYSKRGSFSCSNNPLFHEFGRSLQLSTYKIIAMMQYFLLKWIILLGLVVPPNLRPPNSLSLQMHGFISRDLGTRGGPGPPRIDLIHRIQIFNSQLWIYTYILNFYRVKILKMGKISFFVLVGPP